ncbi:MAG: hypothetical protein IJ801_04195 [Lachnospiraceae bacterium]|nr:hypothetical protein [Lachnospiraceae bacterium]
MKLQYVRAFIVLLAGLVTLIVNMKTHKDVNVSLLIVLIVILVFYVIATLIVEILQRSFETKEADSLVLADDSEAISENGEESEQIPFDEE